MKLLLYFIVDVLIVMFGVLMFICCLMIYVFIIIIKCSVLRINI